jgi:cytochrome c biogenesis protein CcdA
MNKIVIKNSNYIALKSALFMLGVFCVTGAGAVILNSDSYFQLIKGISMAVIGMGIYAIGHLFEPKEPETVIANESNSVLQETKKAC